MASTTTTTTTTTAVRGTIHDNPWAGVGNSHDDGGAQGDNNNNNNNRRAIVLQEGFWLQVLDVVVQVFLCLDACAGTFWFIFGFLLHHKHGNDSVLAVILVMILATCLVLRATLVTAGLWISVDSVFSCQRGGLIAAGYVSLVLAVVLTVGTGVGVFAAAQVQDYMTTHSLDLTPTQQTWLLNHYAWLVGFLAVGALLQAVKWRLYSLYHASLLAWEDEQERLENQHLIRRQAATGRPWWWSSSSFRNGHERSRPTAQGNPQLTQALLADGNNIHTNTHGGSPLRQRQRRGLFSWFRRRSTERSSPSSWARDDGSVDFASVQEEWASRAEEDPMWWSREDEDDDDDNNENANHNMSRTTTDVDTSWAHDVSQV